MAGAACAVVLAVIGIVYGVMYSYVNQYPENRILDHVFIGTQDVSGMTKKEAVQAIQSHHEEHLNYKVTMKVGEESAQATLAELGLEHRGVDQLVESAMDYGKKGPIAMRLMKIRGLEKEPYVVKEVMKLDEKKAEAVIKERAVPLAARAEDAYVERTGDGDFQVVDEKEGYTVNVEASIQKMDQYIEKTWDHSDFEIEMELKKEEPKIKAADLSTIEDELGSFSTDAGGGERWQNLSTGVSKLNGTILMPGESLSVCDATAPYDAEHGYVEAGSYETARLWIPLAAGSARYRPPYIMRCCTRNSRWRKDIRIPCWSIM